MTGISQARLVGVLQTARMLGRVSLAPLDIDDVLAPRAGLKRAQGVEGIVSEPLKLASGTRHFHAMARSGYAYHSITPV